MMLQNITSTLHVMKTKYTSKLTTLHNYQPHAEVLNNYWDEPEWVSHLWDCKCMCVFFFFLLGCTGSAEGVAMLSWHMWSTAQKVLPPNVTLHGTSLVVPAAQSWIWHHCWGLSCIFSQAPSSLHLWRMIYIGYSSSNSSTKEQFTPTLLRRPFIYKRCLKDISNFYTWAKMTNETMVTNKRYLITAQDKYALYPVCEVELPLL